VPADLKTPEVLEAAKSKEAEEILNSMDELEELEDLLLAPHGA